MKSVAKIPTATEINQEHKLARSCAENAVEHALHCGRMLQRVKKDAGHGNFEAWVDANCEFSSATARRYMQVATKTLTRERFDSLRKALGYDKKPEPRKFEPEFPRETVPVVKGSEDPTGETDTDRPAVSVSSEPPVLSERWEPDEDEDAQLALAEKDYEQRVDQIMQADDGIAEAHAQLKQQSALIATLTLSRDGYLSGKNEVVKLLKKEQRKNDRLQKQLKAAQHEIDRLRERIAIKDEAA